MSGAEYLAAQDNETFPNLRACWRVMVEDVVPGTVEPAAFDSYTLPALLSAYRQDQLCQVEASVACIRREGDESDLDSDLWTLCAGESGETAELVETMQHGDLVHEVLDELFDTMGDL